MELTGQRQKSASFIKGTLLHLRASYSTISATSELPLSYHLTRVVSTLYFHFWGSGNIRQFTKCMNYYQFTIYEFVSGFQNDHQWSELRQFFLKALTGADFSNVDFTSFDLPGTTNSLDFRASNLTGANFSGANLSGADFYGATLTGANLSGANLTDVSLPSKITGVDWSNANLSGADFSSITLTGVNFSGYDLSGANFRSADLTDANLSNSLFMEYHV